MLGNKSRIKGMEFWVDATTIHCLITNDFDYGLLGAKTSRIFADQIRILSNCKYRPLFIHLTEVDGIGMLRLFHFFSPCSRYPIFVPSRIFLVRTRLHKWVLWLFCLATGNAFWNTVYSNPTKAIRDCGEHSKTFTIVN